MALTYGFFNSLKGDRKYNAEQVSELFDGILKDGIIPSQGQLFAVTTANNGMQINIGTGRAWFNHTWTKNDSVMVLTVPQSDITRDRWDAVVLEVNHSEDVRANKIKIVSGVAAVNPEKPALTNTDKVHQYPLAYIRVKAAAESILAENIENAVGLEPTVFATGVLETVPLNVLWEQWKGEWTTWFDAIKLQLSGDIVANLQYQIDQVREFSYEIPDSVLQQWGITNPESKAAKDVFEGLFKPVVRTKTYIYTEDAVWSVPSDLIDRKVTLRMFGGGGGGGMSIAGGGGGGGGHMYYGEIAIPEEMNNIVITIGKGGSGGSSGIGGSGGVTSFGTLASASGGSGGRGTGNSYGNVSLMNVTGGDGGSGGGGGGNATYGGGGGGRTSQPGGNGGTYGGGGGGGGAGGQTFFDMYANVDLEPYSGGNGGTYGGTGGAGGSAPASLSLGTSGNSGISGTNTIDIKEIEPSLRGTGAAGNGGSSAAGLRISNIIYKGCGGGGGGGGGYGGIGGNGGNARGITGTTETNARLGGPGGGGGGGGYGGKGGNGGSPDTSPNVYTSPNNFMPNSYSIPGGGGGGYGGNGGDGGSSNYRFYANASGAVNAVAGGGGGGGGGGGYGPNGNGGNGGSGAVASSLVSQCIPTSGGIAAGGGGGGAASPGGNTSAYIAPGANGGDGIVILTYSYLEYMYGNKG